MLEDFNKKNSVVFFFLFLRCLAVFVRGVGRTPPMICVAAIPTALKRKGLNIILPHALSALTSGREPEDRKIRQMPDRPMKTCMNGSLGSGGTPGTASLAWTFSPIERKGLPLRTCMRPWLVLAALLGALFLFHHLWSARLVIECLM